MTALRKSLQKIIDVFRKNEHYICGSHVTLNKKGREIVIYDSPGTDYEYFVVKCDGVELQAYGDEVKLEVNDVGCIAEYNLVAWSMAVYNALTC